MSQSGKQKFIIDVLFVAVVLALGYITVRYLAVWLMPFLLGLALAVMLQRPVNWLTRRTGLSRRVVAPAVTLVVLAALVASSVFLLLALAGEAAKLAAWLPGWFQSTVPGLVYAGAERMETIIHGLPQEWELEIRGLISQSLITVQGQLGSLSGRVITWAANSAAALPGLLISFIITVVAAFFLCGDYDRVRLFFWRQVPEKYKALAGDTWATFARTLLRMLQSYLLIMFITFCELALGFVLLRVEYAVLLAAMIALLDILPVVGTGTALIPWGLVSLLSGNVPRGVGVLLLYVAITVVRNILEPRIIGQRIGLHPLVTLLFMYLGLHLLGVPGMFLFPLIFILLKNAQEAGMLRLWNT